MKKTLLLSFLIPFALVCSCQKQDSTAEQQLAQRKTELDAREKALDEREKALAQQEKLVARRRPVPIPRPVPAVPQGTVPADLQGLMGRMQEIQRKRAAEVQSNERTVPATEQAASPSQSPTPE
jgi:glucose/arabinose dehydrogenase